MKRPTLLLLLALVWFSLGHTSQPTDVAIARIYLVGTTLYRASGGTTVDIFDLSVPTSPRQIGSIPMVGNNDIAVFGNYLYADQNSDLIVIDVSDPSRPVRIDTVHGIFNDAFSSGWGRDFVVDDVGGMQGCGPCAASDAPASAPANSGGAGQGGSLSRFAIDGAKLYCVDYTTLRVFDIIDPARPRYKNAVSVGWGIETVLLDGPYVFMGGETGMSIYKRVGDEITYISEFQHRRSCDPVVVDGNYAYVTLRGGTTCGGFTNQMDVIDISNIASPRLISSYQLAGPYGLAVRNDVGIVCDGAAGLKVLDVSNPSDVRPVATITDIVPHDVILAGSLLVVTTDQGYVLFDASDIRNLKRMGIVA